MDARPRIRLFGHQLPFRNAAADDSLSLVREHGPDHESACHMYKGCEGLVESLSPTRAATVYGRPRSMREHLQRPNHPQFVPVPPGQPLLAKVVSLGPRQLGDPSSKFGWINPLHAKSAENPQEASTARTLSNNCMYRFQSPEGFTAPGSDQPITVKVLRVTTAAYSDMPYVGLCRQWRHADCGSPWLGHC